MCVSGRWCAEAWHGPVSPSSPDGGAADVAAAADGGRPALARARGAFNGIQPSSSRLIRLAFQFDAMTSSSCLPFYFLISSYLLFAFSHFF